MSYQKVQSTKGISTLVKVAREIWLEYFGTLVDEEILEKIIGAVQSKPAILSQIENGFDYYLIVEEEHVIGYFSYKVEQLHNELFLSKVYIAAARRGKGIGRKILDHLEAICRDLEITKISLTVFEKNLAAIRAYKKWGFIVQGIISRELDREIFFNDIKMQKIVSRACSCRS